MSKFIKVGENDYDLDLDQVPEDWIVRELNIPIRRPTPEKIEEIRARLPDAFDDGEHDGCAADMQDLLAEIDALRDELAEIRFRMAGLEK